MLHFTNDKTLKRYAIHFLKQFFLADSRILLKLKFNVFSVFSYKRNATLFRFMIVTIKKSRYSPPEKNAFFCRTIENAGNCSDITFKNVYY